MKTVMLFILLSAFNVHAQQSKDLRHTIGTIETSIKASGAWTQVTNNVHIIQTDAGRTELALRKVNFYKAGHKFKVVEAYSVLNGKRTDVPIKNITIRNADTAKNGISDLMEAVIPFNNLAIGSEVHLKTEVRGNALVGNIFSDMLGISNAGLSDLESYTYISDLPLQTVELDFHDYYQVKKTNEGAKFKVVYTPTQLAYQTKGVKVRVGMFMVTSAKDWKQVREAEFKSFSRVFKKDLPPQYKAMVQKVSKEPHGVKQIDAVAKLLAEHITYAGAWNTQDGKRVPQPLATAAASGRGDCKDYSAGMVAILRKLNYEAYPFLTFRSQSFLGNEKLKALSQIPSPHIFNHVIVFAKSKDGQSWWIDPTNPYVQADVITSDILGNYGLVLNETSDNIAFLPEKNSEPSELNLEQIVTIAADNSVRGSAKVSMSRSTYNSFGMIERLYGQEGTKGIYSRILNPYSKSTMIEFREKAPFSPRVSFDFMSSDWLISRQQQKTLLLVSPLLLIFSKFNSEQDNDLGEPGKMTFKTTVHGRKLNDPTQYDCLVRSPWLDVDRTLQNTGEGFELNEVINLKQRHISSTLSHGDLFDAFSTRIQRCLSRSAIVIQEDPELLSASDLKEVQRVGPSIDVMTDADAERLYNLKGPNRAGLVSLKLYRYYSKKISQSENPQADWFFRKGESVIDMGYIHSEIFTRENLLEGLDLMDQAVKLGQGENQARYLMVIVRRSLILGDLNRAMTAFNVLWNKHKNSFHVYMGGGMIAMKNKNYETAVKSFLSGEPHIKDDIQRLFYHAQMNKLYSEMGRKDEAFVHQERAAHLDADNPWALHNLAAEFLVRRNYDKVIELEKKVLAMADFGAARSVMSDAYLWKAIELRKKSKDVREIASVADREELLMQSLSYNSENLHALTEAAFFYLNQYKQTKDALSLSKGRSYLERGMKINPRDAGIAGAMLRYQKIEKKPLPPFNG